MKVQTSVLGRNSWVSAKHTPLLILRLAGYSPTDTDSVALVRALMKGTKIVLLDEATSSVDPETDALIQRVIQSHFKHVTVSPCSPIALPCSPGSASSITADRFGASCSRLHIACRR